MHNATDMNLQIFQGTGFQRGGVHATSCAAMTSAGFHAGGVYATTRPVEPPPAPEPAPVVLPRGVAKKRRSV